MVRRVQSLVWILLLALIISGCTVTVNGPSTGGTGGSSGSSGSSGQPSTQEPNWGVQSKTTSCQAHNGLQDQACTPGDILKDATAQKICVSGYAKSVRNVPVSEKNQVYAAYGIRTHSTGQYEVDHLVSLELGGSNDISNLWPEAASPKPGFHEKDQVENYLHDQVCSGKMTLKQAQIKIATNWLDVYQSMPKQTSSSGGY